MLGVVIFFDAENVEDTFTPFSASAMGLVPHVFTVVQPHPTETQSYRYF